MPGRVWSKHTCLSLALGLGLGLGALAATLATPSRAANPVITASGGVMSPWDVQIYLAALQLTRAGDFETASKQIELLQDRSLAGYVEFERLFHPTYTASYQELTQWLSLYGELPMAGRVWNLAKRRKPEGSPDPDLPPVLAKSATRAWLRIDTAVTSFEDNKPGPEFTGPKAARSALNDGRLEEAVKTGLETGDRWVAGLAAYRLKRYDQALGFFEKVAVDPALDPWVRAGGGVWAARAADQLKKPEQAERYLKMAAAYPFTFYGLIAEKRLGVEPAVIRAQKGQLPVYSPELRGVFTPQANFSLSSETMQKWLQADPNAKRIAALSQIGLRQEAGLEIKQAVQLSRTDEERDRWLSYALSLGVSLNTGKDGSRSFDLSAYPVPGFKPEGGFIVEKALVLALARKESKFNPQALSSVGAVGLLQMMPTTAQLLAKSEKFNPAELRQPEKNLKYGQIYLSKMLARDDVQGDLLRLIAAYNAGPLRIRDTLKLLEPDADALTLMESIPVAQTRAYVEEVAAAYWIYRHILGQDTETLNALARGDKQILASLDRTDLPPGEPGSDRLASLGSERAGLIKTANEKPLKATPARSKKGARKTVLASLDAAPASADN